MYLMTPEQDRNSEKNCNPRLAKAGQSRKEGRLTHPWQPARLIGWNSVWVGQCDIRAVKQHMSLIIQCSGIAQMQTRLTDSRLA